MNATQSFPTSRPNLPGFRLVIAGAALMLVAIATTAFLLIEENGGLDGYPYLFLLPWIFALAVVFVAPAAFLLYKNKLSLTSPVIFPVWSYLFPAFVLGGFFLAGGWQIA